jgi:hypothetical protein
MAHDAPPPDHWTPALVEERLIEAVTFLRHSERRVGPRGYHSAMPRYTPTIEDHLAEGWGMPEPPDDDDGPEEPLPRYTAAQVEGLHAALSWVGKIIAPEKPDMARAVNAWIFAKAYGRPFNRVLRARGIARTRAYALRDRGLATISVRLQARGVPAYPGRAPSDRSAAH